MMQQLEPQQAIDYVKEYHLKILAESDIDSKANYQANVGHYNYLIHVTLSGPWFYINGEKDLKFKTRGNNERDLRAALIKYDIDWWESDLKQCARDMADQLYWQARKKHEPFKVEAIA